MNWFTCAAEYVVVQLSVLSPSVSGVLCCPHGGVRGEMSLSVPRTTHSLSSSMFTWRWCGDTEVKYEGERAIVR